MQDNEGQTNHDVAFEEDIAASVDEVVDMTQFGESRLPLLILVDVSGSMAGDIEALNESLAQLGESLARDEKLRACVDIQVIRFGSDVKIHHGWVMADDYKPDPLTVGGTTPMGAGLMMALDEIDKRIKEYRGELEVKPYHPMIFVLTDGMPTDGEVFDVASAKVKALDAKGKLFAYVFSTEEGGPSPRLSQVTNHVAPDPNAQDTEGLVGRPRIYKLNNVAYEEFFEFVSMSVSGYFQSVATGTAYVNPVPGEQIDAADFSVS